MLTNLTSQVYLTITSILSYVRVFRSRTVPRNLVQSPRRSEVWDGLSKHLDSSVSAVPSGCHDLFDRDGCCCLCRNFPSVRAKNLRAGRWGTHHDHRQLLSVEPEHHVHASSHKQPNRNEGR